MPCEERLHVGERVDGDALAPDLAERARVIGVVAHQRRHVEGGREPGLAVLEQVAEALVRLLGRAEAGELAHRPEAAAVHRRVDAARERILARDSRGRARTRSPRSRACRAARSRSPRSSRRARRCARAPSRTSRSARRRATRRPGPRSSPSRRIVGARPPAAPMALSGDGWRACDRRRQLGATAAAPSDSRRRAVRRRVRRRRRRPRPPDARASRTHTPAATRTQGIRRRSRGHGIRATITLTRRPTVDAGHVAGWVGVGGQGQGATGGDAWIQAGIASLRGLGTVVYAEITQEAHEPELVLVDEDVEVGRAYRIAVLEVAGRPGWWRVWVDGRPVTPMLRMRGTSGRWAPIATAESWNAGTSACNDFAFRFERVSVSSGRARLVAAVRLWTPLSRRNAHAPRPDGVGAAGGGVRRDLGARRSERGLRRARSSPAAAP